MADEIRSVFQGGWTELQAHFYNGLEIDPDCCSWHDPDNFWVPLLKEWTFVLPMIYIVWSRTPAKVTAEFLNEESNDNEECSAEEREVDEFKKSTNAVQTAKQRNRSILKATTRDRTLGLLSLLPLFLVIHMRWIKNQVGTIGHLCHIALIGSFIVLTGLPMRNLFGEGNLYLMRFWLMPMTASCIPALVSPDWRGYSKAWDREISVASILANFGIENASIGESLVNSSIKVNLYSLSFYAEHGVIFFLSWYLIFGSRFQPLFKRYYERCFYATIWNTFLAGYLCLETVYSIAAWTVKYNIAYQLCPPAVIKKLAIRMLKGYRQIYCMVENVTLGLRTEGGAIRNPECQVPEYGVHFTPYNGRIDVWGRQLELRENRPNGKFPSSGKPDNNLAYNHWHWWYNMCIITSFVLYLGIVWPLLARFVFRWKKTVEFRWKKTMGERENTGEQENSSGSVRSKKNQ